MVLTVALPHAQMLAPPTVFVTTRPASVLPSGGDLIALNASVPPTAPDQVYASMVSAPVLMDGLAMTVRNVFAFATALSRACANPTEHALAIMVTMAMTAPSSTVPTTALAAVLATSQLESVSATPSMTALLVRDTLARTAAPAAVSAFSKQESASASQITLAMIALRFAAPLTATTMESA